MVDERDDRYENDEGEYHFSDDQVNYEEVETPKSAPSTGSIKKSIVDRFSGLSPTRRMLLAGVVFIVLIGVVYKMLLPSSPVLSSDIVSTKKEAPEVAAAKPATQTTTPAQAPVNAPAPVTQQAAAPIPQNVAVQQGMPNPSELPPQVMPQQPQQIQQAMYPPQQPPQAAAPTQATMPMGAPLPPTAVTSDRLKAVEDHNAAIMNLLQNEYAQKMSEFEMQSNLVRGKMDEMAKRVNRIESSLNQITQLLQQSAPRANKAQMAANENIPALPTRSAVPKVTYTVQAIIPGRAWLKGDSGDTVTVAEGDTLRDYGRITKIDPYDGVVEIDTGNKIIALSYGMSGE